MGLWKASLPSPSTMNIPEQKEDGVRRCKIHRYGRWIKTLEVLIKSNSLGSDFILCCMCFSHWKSICGGGMSPFCSLYCSGCILSVVRLGSKVGTVSQVTFPKLLIHSFLKLSLK